MRATASKVTELLKENMGEERRRRGSVQREDELSFCRSGRGEIRVALAVLCCGLPDVEGCAE